MRKILAIFLALIILTIGFFFNTQKATAKEKKPYIFINYTGKTGKTGICTATTNDQVNMFGVAGWRLNPGITDYRLNFSSKPRTWSNDSFKNAIELAFSTVQGGGGGILFHYAGESRENKATNDSQNTVMWQVLPGGVAAMTYIWTDNGRLVDADTVLNQRYAWNYTSYNGSNDCDGPKAYFDLRDIATHEFGHWVGLGDLYDSRAKDLTMYGYASRGELKKDTLGLGDITGVRALWP